MRLAIVAALLVACSGAPINPSPSYGGGSSVGGQSGTCEAMCQHITELGCVQPTCLDDCKRITADDRFGLDLDCRIKATSIAEVQACGPASCREYNQ